MLQWVNAGFVWRTNTESVNKHSRHLCNGWGAFLCIMMGLKYAWSEGWTFVGKLKLTFCSSTTTQYCKLVSASPAVVLQMTWQNDSMGVCFSVFNGLQKFSVRLRGTYPSRPLHGVGKTRVNDVLLRSSLCVKRNHNRPCVYT